MSLDKNHDLEYDERAETDRSHKSVLDEEGDVDQKVKHRILKARERIDDREDLLFVQAAANPGVHLSHVEKVEAWGTSVRQYIRAIEPLLKSDEMPQSRHYYREAPLLKTEIAPPDTNGYEWSMFARDGVDARTLAREMGLPPSFDPPEPKQVELRGLFDIIDKTNLETAWQFTIPGKSGSMVNGETMVLEETLPIPKSVYEEAVSLADEFLQQAGVGLEIGTPQVDDQDLEGF